MTVHSHKLPGITHSDNYPYTVTLRNNAPERVNHKSRITQTAISHNVTNQPHTVTTPQSANHKSRCSYRPE